jgi:hypothetical protein
MENAAIKTAAYITAPMRYILRAEKAGRDMRNVPILYQNHTILEDEGILPNISFE